MSSKVDEHTLRLEAIAYWCRSIHNAAVGKYVRESDEETYEKINECLDRAHKCIKSIAVNQDHCPRPWCDADDECIPCGG